MAQQTQHGGLFITFEGGDGSGKTTHIRFLEAALADQGREVVRLREPGGTTVGEAMRDVVLDPSKEVCDRAELLMYEAARAQLVDEVVRPALERGAVVLCDRFFDSTTAYQAHGRGIDARFVQLANDFACDGCIPDRTVLIATEDDPRAGLERALKHRDGDRMERAGVEFHWRVKEAFRSIAQDNPDRVRVVDMQPTKAATAKLVFLAVADLFGWEGDSFPFDDAYFQAANLIHGSSSIGKGC